MGDYMTEDSQSKTCTKCRQTKSVTEFHHKRYSADGTPKKHPMCKRCHQDASNERRRRNASVDPDTVTVRRIISARRENATTQRKRLRADELLDLFANELDRRQTDVFAGWYDGVDCDTFARAAAGLRQLGSAWRSVRENTPENPDKQCTKCGEYKELSDFRILRKYADGRIAQTTVWCRSCIQEQNEKSRTERNKLAKDRMMAAMVRDMNKGEE